MEEKRLHIEGINRFTGTMKHTRQFLKIQKFLLAASCLVFSVLDVFGQIPEIKSLDKVKGPNGDIVSISGSNFGTNANQLVVFFGAAKGTIQSVSNQLIEVTIPAGTTYQFVSVTNTTTGLTGYSRPSFLLSYGGGNPFEETSLVGQTDFNAESGLYDLCMCDLDGDGKVDIAAANDNANAISVFPNSSSGPGNVNFGKIPILLNTRSIHIKCGDLNGDGKPDLVVSEGGDGSRIFILQNGSTGAGNFIFSTQIITLTGRKTKRVEIADLDLDGKPELIVTDQGSNTVSILQNQSTLGSISFAATPILITISGAASTDALAVGDLNGDLIPEILVSQFLTGTSNLYLIPNTSIPGALSFGTVVTRAVPGTIVNLRIGDLDGDNKQDIAATQLLSSQVSIFLNQSTNSTFTFAAPVNIAGGDRPWGIDFGDLDGDGKPDIVVGSITQKNLTILNNTSTVGSLNFTSITKATTFINRHVSIGDVDTDGKPDIAFTSIDDNNLGIVASRVSIFRNKHCLIPEIRPAGPINICTGFPLRLNANSSRGVTYEWREGANPPIKTGSDSFLDVTVSGSYTVTAISEGGTCSELSNAVTVNIGAGSVSGTATATNNGPVCVGSTLQLNINALTGATGYRWTGPDGFTSTTQNPNIPNFTLAKAGKYTVEILAGTCVAREVSTVVEAIDAPNFTVAFTAPAVFCQGNTKTLSVSPVVSGFTYQWFEKTSGLISNADDPTLVVSSGGEYYYQGSVAGCSTIESSSVVISSVTPPVVDFTSPATSCSGQQVQFTDQSTAGTGATYLWTFGDSNTSTEQNPTHVYATATGSPFNVKLVVSYSGACPSELTKQIAITAAPTMTISNPGNTFIFCPGESLRLEVLGGFDNYTWSTGATNTSFIDVTSAGTYSVQVNESGCTLFDDQVVTLHPSPVVNILADPQQIISGSTTQLQASGLVSYAWTPTESLSNPSIPNPIATPLTSTVYTVVGPDANGCEGEGTIQISVQGEAVVTKLKPENFFSPNGDASNPFWVVGEIENYPQCSVAIYDDKGVRVFEATPYLNNWDGTFNGNGKQLPDGVYYYIIRCAGEENNPRSGSITLLR